MPPSPQPEGEIIPPQYHEASARPMPDYAQEQIPPRNRGRNFFSAPGTYLLLAINCGVFLWMILHGVSASSPTPGQLVHFGANVPALVLQGEWYRLLTATFVHVGLIHLATNMWCLWNLGLLGEPLLGPFGLVAVYILTGIAGNLLSMGINVWMRDYVSVGAGASGAVFGIAGILIVLLSNHKLPIPIFELKRLRRSVIQFAALNLVIGLSTAVVPVGIRIDNSAHLGGFLSGLALGVPLAPRMTAGRARYLQRQKLTFAGAVFFLSLFGYWIANLK
ncbi:MAG TPA: rhomboid family intramembrane serine protease [Edaphobacter sp.]|nr:rhomboid family intramembrane serine protease [Edaphobacter sp.]